MLSPVSYSSLLQAKSGKEFLKDYYLKHRALSEKDLDDLVTKSSMSYEQVREWFSETAKRVEEGKEPFSDEEGEGEEDEEEEVAAEQADSDGEMEVKEQGDEASDDDCNEEEEEEVEDGETMQEEDEGVSQSQPQAEEQT